ncbi:2-keto-4-pentenoate hydratase/2-oxohepta-3-ene-1,7-dioic acid hydratase in catechol pathway [Oikeobacillus pervagus]|uniref:2-keto-4-pentenoate hydratase/2-oxohepta-3-ene-1,7-dioic acid hydratase in catechol pathway n=1 Tax=Oikeobacillus pervagus TaxID=1325931 RepID=A0AAJ1T0Y2_9BACI|nr:fumarylacetoacetate hydrolase family protein [Oikeobacillus pervagus]MDQ0214792.1 2-keto-4-pentenoate hydratase/2-oxohepta-3-ene-1,7-dioic acid hydratase in catechol pathway [Oikeobacillus pervagus]
MKFVSYLYNQEEQFGVWDEDQKGIWNLQAIQEKYGKKLLPNKLVEAIDPKYSLIETVKELLAFGKEHKTSSFLQNVEEIEWLAPIPRPTKNIVCIGKNYREHAIELGGEESIPSDLMVFTKAPTTVTSHQASIPSYSEVTDALDYEGELAIIIGKKGINIAKEDALDYLFGLTIINDITARDIQKRHKQFFLGKSLDQTCPMGPWIVTKDEVPHPESLEIETKVNGEVRQQSNTKYFIFPIDEIISTLSKGMTLEPGDIIATGTPAGVGLGFDPPKLLKSGDEIEITIQQVGTLFNRVN